MNKKGELKILDCSNYSINFKKKGQVWIEAVTYTLIAFTMIGLVLAVAKPKIEEMQDKAIIEQSIEIIEGIDSVISNIGCSGNQRIIELGIKKGTFKIDGENDKIIFEIKGKHEYSEPEQNITRGNIIANTKKIGKEYLVTLTRDYSDRYNITYQGKDESKSITKASIPYKLSILNKGGEKTVIDIDIS